MVKNGYVRAQTVQASEITAKCRSFLEEIAVPAYYEWCIQPRWIQQLLLGAVILPLMKIG